MRRINETTKKEEGNKTAAEPEWPDDDATADDDATVDDTGGDATQTPPPEGPACGQ